MTANEQVHPVIQTMKAYQCMANVARYRPAAPSDGMGTITASLNELDFTAEAREYADGWWKEEGSGDYGVGCPAYEDRPALVFIIEAARNLTGSDRARAAVLLRMALEELDAR